MVSLRLVVRLLGATTQVRDERFLGADARVGDWFWVAGTNEVHFRGFGAIVGKPEKAVVGRPPDAIAQMLMGWR